jgi:hypothetical protein
MTTETGITILNWHNQPVRIINEQNTAYIPIGDIALAIGMDKRTLQRLLDRNPKEFSSNERVGHLTTPGGIQNTRCLDYMGTISLLFRISLGHLKDDATRERLLEFRRFIIEQVIENRTTIENNNQKPVTKPLALPAPERETAKPLPDWISKVMQHLEFADLFAAHTQSDLTRARMFALDAASKETGINLHAYKSLIPGVVSQEKGYLNPTQIADRITRPERTFTAFNVNKYLENHGYQLRDENAKWQPTEKGEPYTIKIPWTKGSESGLQVLWHERIIAESKMG